jgi:glyoxylase-like metal-dependent hydrolase (beta-lactamase superfamily II)
MPHARRLLMLHFGAEPSPKSISVRGGPDRIIWCPIEAGHVLLETGIGRSFLDDEPARRAIYQSEEQPWGLAGEPLETALAGVGLRVDELALAVVSHLHCDHSGGLPLLARAGVPVVIHADELAFSRTAGLAEAYYAPDYHDPEPEWRPVDGDAEIAPGVTVLATPGHTPGHLSYRVDLPASGTWLLAVDAADLAENLDDRVPPGSCASPGDEPRAETSLHRLLAEAERLDARLVPGHDEAVWTMVRHPEGGHR